MSITITLVASGGAGATDNGSPAVIGYGADQNEANENAAAQALRRLADDVESGAVDFSALESISIVYDPG